MTQNILAVAYYLLKTFLKQNLITLMESYFSKPENILAPANPQFNT